MRRIVVALVESEEPIGAELGSAWVANEVDGATLAGFLEREAGRVRALGVAGTVAATTHARGTHREARR